MKEPKWDLDEGEVIYWIGAEAAYSLLTMRRIYGFNINRNVFSIADQSIFNWYTLTKELREIGNKCLNKFKDKEFRKKIVDGFWEIKNQLDLETGDVKIL